MTLGARAELCAMAHRMTSGLRGFIARREREVRGAVA